MNTSEENKRKAVYERKLAYENGVRAESTKLDREVKIIVETAVTLHFLMVGFEQQINNCGNPDFLDSLGCGQDGFTYNCYDIAEAIEILNLDVAKDRGCPGIYHYEAIEEIASKILFDYVDTIGTMPLVLEFIGRFKPLLEKWYEGE